MTEWYIDGANGDNTNGGNSANDPVKDFDNVTLSGGDEYYMIDGPIDQNNAVTFAGEDGTSSDKTLITNYDGSFVTVDFSTAADGFDFRNSQHFRIEHCLVKQANRHNIRIFDSGGGTGEATVLDVESTEAGQGGSNGSGISIQGTGTIQNVTVDDCFCHRNTAAGGNSDGIIASTGAEGTVIKNCEIAYNADDGIDLLEHSSGTPATIDNTIIHHSSIDDTGSNLGGNGNGIKMGSSAANTGGHTVQRVLSYRNWRAGFNGNNHDTALTLYNCGAWQNGESGDNSNDDAGYRMLEDGDPADEMRNCWAHDNPAGHLTQESANIDIQFCSFSTTGTTGEGVADVTDDDFQSLDNSKDAFLRLAKDSDMIDAGTDVGLTFNGDAPDLGPFETEAVTNPTLYLRQGGVWVPIGS